jgi:AcrR family transcriptional regulator
MEEGKKCLSLYGIRKTTVDELVKRVKIPKGTFYLFYESKDLLFYDIFCALHDEMQEKLLAELAVLEGDMDAGTLTNLFFSLYKSLDDSYLLKLITSGACTAACRNG